MKIGGWGVGMGLSINGTPLLLKKKIRLNFRLKIRVGIFG